MSLNPIVKMLRLPGQVVGRVRAKGLSNTWSRIRFLAHTAWWERKLGINTRGFIPWHFLGPDPDSVDYEPVGYVTLTRAFAELKVSSNDVLLDYGCGMGRPVCFATRFPFRRIIGVELSDSLVDDARRNAAKAMARRSSRAGIGEAEHSPSRPQRVEVLQADAKTWKVPDDVTVAFFFNPFMGHILQGAIDQLLRSLSRNPRDMTIIYVQPLRDESIFDTCDWLRCDYRVESEGLRLAIYRSTT
jgi:SAM-dependent methyltransferase